jgi:RND family efflux transporter MFP subunit
MDLKRLMLLLASVLLLLPLVGCGNKTATVEEEYLMPVEVVKTQTADLAQLLNTSGEIIPGAEVSVAPKVTGRVAALHVKVGDHVSQGQVLFQLEATEALNAKKLAEAGVGVAEAGLSQAQQSLADAQLNYDRQKALYEASAIPKSQFEQAESMLTNARIGVQLAEQQLIQAQLSVQNAQTTYDNFTVYSPLTGTVAAVNLDEGEMASPQVTAITVVQLSTVKTKVHLSENAVVNVKEGMNVEVTINALNKTVPGTIVSVAPKADSLTRAFPVEIRINNEQGDIKAGMVAQLQLETGKSAGVIALPVDAVLERDGQFYVFAVVDGMAKEIAVKTGLSSAELVEITEGLTAGQDIILKGNHLVADGQKVEVVNAQGGSSN